MRMISGLGLLELSRKSFKNGSKAVCQNNVFWTKISSGRISSLTGEVRDLPTDYINMIEEPDA